MKGKYSAEACRCNVQSGDLISLTRFCQLNYLIVELKHEMHHPLKIGIIYLAFHYTYYFKTGSKEICN